MADDYKEPLQIEFRSIGRKVWDAAYGEQLCATFKISGDYWQIEMPVWVWSEEIAPDDAVRTAKHNLHLLLRRLADETAHYRIDGDEPEAAEATEAQPPASGAP